MTETRLADMIVPEVFAAYVTERTAAKSALFQSGIVTDMTADLFAELGGVTINMPFFKDLAGSSQVVEDTTDLTVNKVTTSQDVAISLYRAQVYGGTDLAADIAGADPIDTIVDRFADWWVRDLQTILIAQLNGTMGAASMSGNVFDISALTGGAEIFDGESFIDATLRLGDAAENLAAVAVHSAVYGLMKKQDLIDFIPDSMGGKPIPVYMGKRVIVDDGMPVSSGTYTTYIFGPGVIGFGEKAAKKPVEMERRALIGGGQEYLVNRRRFVLHTRGIKWLGASLAGTTPTNAELSTTTNWQRVYENKNIRLVAFKHKIA
jgi:hypothetical protein